MKGKRIECPFDVQRVLAVIIMIGGGINLTQFAIALRVGSVEGRVVFGLFGAGCLLIGLRAAAARIVVHPAGVKMHGVLRNRFLRAGSVTLIEFRPFNGSYLLRLVTDDGAVYVPLILSGNIARVRNLAAQISDATGGQLGQIGGSSGFVL